MGTGVAVGSGVSVLAAVLRYVAPDVRDWNVGDDVPL